MEFQLRSGSKQFQPIDRVKFRQSKSKSKAGFNSGDHASTLRKLNQIKHRLFPNSKAGLVSFDCDLQSAHRSCAAYWNDCNAYAASSFTKQQDQ